MMGKIILTIKTSLGEISVEGDSPTDLRNTLLSLGISEESINKLLETVKQRLQTPELPIPVSVAPSKPEVIGVIEYGSDGIPHITVSPDKLTAKEVIGLLLYAKSPNPISMSELAELVVNNWKSVEMPYVSSNLNMMKAFVIKEGSRGSFSYKLSGSGRNWVENELLPKLKLKKPESA
jgi:hypothetical protein